MDCRRPPIETPLLAAFFCIAAWLGGCGSAEPLPLLPQADCAGAVTPVAAIQGEALRSPMEGERVSVRSVVTLVLPGRGLFLEDLPPDGLVSTSDGLYVDDGELAATVNPGDRIVVAGEVAELGTDDGSLTALTDLRGYRRCEQGIPPPISDARLPMDRPAREALEGMHLMLQQPLSVTDVYPLAQGRLGISQNEFLPAPTEVARPGAEAREQRRANRDRLLYVELGPYEPGPVAVGTSVLAAQGVLGEDRKGHVLHLSAALPAVPMPIYRVPPPGEDEVRVLGLNLLNYFNGDGQGGGFPGARGARSAEAFADQRERLAGLFRHVQPQLLAVSELENDGFGPGSAILDLRADLAGPEGTPWAVIDPHGGAPIGNAIITVGLLYRSDLLEPEGPPQVLPGGVFNRRSRQPLAQSFRHRASGLAFLVVANHFKSKGGCPADGPDADKRDGQGCWNAARVDSARRLSAWVHELAGRLSDGRALILGDLNAYRLEDPIQAIIEAGFKDLTASGGFRPEYSYVYGGEAGTLDYAFASEALRPHVRMARILNINAGYPPGAELEPFWLGASDHDPVLVDLRLRQAATLD